jgi:hypothetical protein
MPVETIKCRECGSAEVTEFKPGSYVCGHCEAVFKHVPPAGTGVGCEIDGCGVAARGRCSSCTRAVCATHQAGAQCTACQADAWARQEEDRQADAQRRYEADQVSRAAYEEEREKWLGRCRDLLASIDDPVGRQVCALREATSIKTYNIGQPQSTVEGISVDLEFLKSLLPGNTDPDRWDDSAVVTWFLGAVKKPPSKQPYGPKLPFRGRRRLVDVWFLDCGWTDDDAMEGRQHWSHIFKRAVVLADGRRRFVERSGPGVLELRDEASLNANALCQMAYLAELPRLPPPPAARRLGGGGS